jgi:hypothetical protein
MDDMDNFDLLSAEKVAAKYGGDKRKIGEAAQMGLVNPTVAVMAGMFIDRMRAAAVQEQQPSTTVAQDTFTPPVQMAQAGLGATPQAQTAPQMAPQTNTQMAAAPSGTVSLAKGGLSSLPVDEDMFPDEYAGGGIVAFQGGDLVRGVGTETYPTSLSQTQVDPATLRAYYLSKGMPLPLELMTATERLRSDPTSTLGPMGKSFEELGRPAAPGAASSLGEMFSNIGSRIAGLGSGDTRIDPVTGKEVSFGEYMRLEDARRAAAAGKQPPTPTATTGTDPIETLRAKAAASRESMSPENRALYDENISGIKRIAEAVAPKTEAKAPEGKAPEGKATEEKAPKGVNVKAADKAITDYAKKIKEFNKEFGVSDEPDAKARAALDKYKEKLNKDLDKAGALGLVQAGLGIAGGKSQYALSNLQGAIPAIEQYGKAMSQIREGEKGILDSEAKLDQAADARARGNVKLALELEKDARELALNERKVAATERQVSDQAGLRREIESGRQEQRYLNMMQNARRTAMNNIVQARKLDITAMDQNQLATLEREADALLSRDPAYQSMYKKIYGEAYAPTPMASAAVDYGKMYGLTPKKQ